MRTIVWVGSGLSTSLTLWHYLKKQKGPCRHIWFRPINPKSTSLCSTATLALHGIEKGVSDLGDLLFEGHFFADHWLKENNPSGVWKGEWEQIVFYPDEQQKKRFSLSQQTEKVWKGSSDCWIFHPEQFLSFLVDEILSYQVELRDEFFDPQNYSYDQLFLGTGAIDEYGLNSYFPQKISAVPGVFWQWDHPSDQSKVVSAEGVNLIYRPDDTLILGATTGELNDCPDWFDHAYQLMTELVGALPEKEKAQMICGYRPKAPKRRPLYGQLAPQIFGINGLYKSGYNLAFLLGEKCAKEMLNGSDALN